MLRMTNFTIMMVKNKMLRMTNFMIVIVKKMKKMTMMSTTVTQFIISPGSDGQAEDLLPNMVNIHHHHILILPHLV